jgi:hypothetical protein
LRAEPFADLPPFLAAFFAVLPPVFLAVFLRGRAVLVAGSSPSSNIDCEDEGVEEGVLSIGNGSIHPEPDQPISK